MSIASSNKPPSGVKNVPLSGQLTTGNASRCRNANVSSTGSNAQAKPVQVQAAKNSKDASAHTSMGDTHKNGKHDSSLKQSLSADTIKNSNMCKSKSQSHESLNCKKFSDSTPSVKPGIKTTSLKTPKVSTSKDHLKTNTPFAKPKPVKNISGLRKASSTQSIDKSGVLSSQSYNCPTTQMKRATSTHNVIKNNRTYNNDKASPPLEVMSYNAELLANFEKEKKNYESRISELVQLAEGRKAEIEKNKIEMKRLKQKDTRLENKEEFEMLKSQNKWYKERLTEFGVALETLPDSQKLISRNNSRHGTSSETSELPASTSFDSLSMECNRSSIAGEAIADAGEHATFLSSGEHTVSINFDELCPDQNWDKQSNKSSDAMSEVALQNLTERILEMEETNYSTTEELQATLQELGDLQDSVNSLTDQNEGLAMERELLFQSLHTQTKKLQKCRSQNEQLKSLLIGTTIQSKSEREKTLEDLLRSAQEEREELLCLQKELGNAVYVAENENKELINSSNTLKENVQELEDTLKTAVSEKQNLENKLTLMNEAVMNEQIELNRYKSLYEAEKSKVVELEECAKATDKSDIEELLHIARSEKDKIELKLTNTHECLAHTQCEVSKLKDQISRKDEELKVTKNNVKTQIDTYDLRLKTLENENEDHLKEIATLQDHIDQLDQDCDRYIEEKKTDENKLQELRSELNIERQMHTKVLAQMNDQKSFHEEKNCEWDQFQKDLQMAVVVANDFKREKEVEIEEILKDKKLLMEQNHQLIAELNLVKEETNRLKTTSSIDLHPSKALNKIAPVEPTRRISQSASPLEKELATLRDSRRQDNKNPSFSVKNLIKTIEEHVKLADCPTSPTAGIDLESTRHTSVVAAEIVKEEIQKSPITDTGKIIRRNSVATENHPLKSALKKHTQERSPLQRHSSNVYDKPTNVMEASNSPPPITIGDSITTVTPRIASILSRSTGNRRNSLVGDGERRESVGGKDPLQVLVKNLGGSKRNALLKWCQQKTRAYRGVDITNFSSSWNDGLAFCAILHNYLPDKIPFSELSVDDKKHNFLLAFEAAESVGILSTLDISDMAAIERPDWRAVMAYVTSIYKHFELDYKT